MTDATTKYYTGVGSRETPPEILDHMELYAEVLRRKGYILRSGGADGADSAFAAGAKSWAEIYLPWEGFNDQISPFRWPLEWTYDVAASVHPAWDELIPSHRKLHARNVHQVLGWHPYSVKSKFVLCWTPDGEASGGTATAIRVAINHNIPVHNLFHGPVDISVLLGY